MKNQPQAPPTTGRYYVRASSRFARRLWCRVFNHRWNQISIGEPTQRHAGGGLYREITVRQCLRCGKDGPASWWRYDPIATFVWLHP